MCSTTLLVTPRISVAYVGCELPVKFLHLREVVSAYIRPDVEPGIVVVYLRLELEDVAAHNLHSWVVVRGAD
jgi:hypothetical protein